VGRYGLTQLNYLVVIKLGVRNSFYLNWYLPVEIFPKVTMYPCPRGAMALV
jgi:hypothetical protein